MSPPAKTPARPVIMSGPTLTTPSVTSMPAHALEAGEVGSWPSASTSESASSSSTSPVGCGKPVSSSSIRSITQLALVDLLDRRQPLHHHALLLGLGDLDLVGGHALAVAPVDDDRLLGAEPLRGPGRVHRRVAAAVDRDPAAEQRLLALLEVVQHRDRVDHLRRRCRRGCRRACRSGRRRRGRRRRSRRRHRLDEVGRPWRRAPASPRGRGSARTSASRTSRGSRYLGIPNRIIPPAIGPASRIVTAWPSQRQVVGGREPRGPGADDEHPLAGSARPRPPPASPARIASSPRKRSTELIPTASSSWARLQEVSQGW